jgi:hypothetical protein
MNMDIFSEKIHDYNDAVRFELQWVIMAWNKKIELEIDFLS